MSAGVEVPVEQSYGEVFTREWIVDTLLDLTGYTVDQDLGALTLVEPSAGSGAFMLPVVRRLLDSAQLHKRAPKTLVDSLRVWELKPAHALACRAALISELLARKIDAATAKYLAARWVVESDFLLPDRKPSAVAKNGLRADVVIGNPPYIRLEDISTELTAAYRSQWPTMGGRADVYVGFIERSLKLLRPGGRVGFICADRWMRNQYGAGLRRMISGSYAVDAVWLMHDVDAFKTQVSAYPAITVLRNGEQGSAVAADTTAGFDATAAAELVKWSLADGENAQFTANGVRAYRLPHWFSGNESWPIGSPERLRLIEYLNDHFRPLHDTETGTKVSIGVATGADRVFVSQDTDVVEPDRLLPLAMVSDLAGGELQWSGHYLVDPWDTDGKLVDLDGFPLLKRYFDNNGQRLADRHIAKKNPGAWYRTIDKVHHDLTARPKLLLQDMKTNINPVLDPGGCYPHHNLYYVISGVWEMEVLGGLLMSRISQAFIEAYGVRMRGGTLRFQSQYLKRIRVPDPNRLDEQIKKALRVAFRERDVDAATVAAGVAYGINPKDYDLV